MAGRPRKQAREGRVRHAANRASRAVSSEGLRASDATKRIRKLIRVLAEAELAAVERCVEEGKLTALDATRRGFVVEAFRLTADGMLAARLPTSAIAAAGLEGLEPDGSADFRKMGSTLARVQSQALWAGRLGAKIEDDDEAEKEAERRLAER